VQALCAFGVLEIMIVAIYHYMLVGLITIKTGNGQGNTLPSILFLIATEHLRRILATSFIEIAYCTEEGITVSPVLYADDNLTPLAIRTVD
jgi:hypothetical protein